MKQALGGNARCFFFAVSRTGSAAGASPLRLEDASHPWCEHFSQGIDTLIRASDDRWR